MQTSIRTRLRGLLLAALVMAVGTGAPAVASAGATPRPTAPRSGGTMGSTLAGHAGTMGSQLPLWAGKGIHVPAQPGNPRATPAILGGDISQWQGPTSLALYDRAFILVREQYGTAGLDTQFVSNRDQARARGLLRGWYHYAYPEFNSAESEARTFALGTDWRAGEIAVLDMEEPGDWVGWSLAFMQAFQGLEHFRPLLYVNVYTLYAYDWGPVARNGNGLLAARWDWSLSQPPSGAFEFAAGKQYSDQESIAGIAGRVDGDVFYGDAAGWQKYGAPGAAPNPGPPTPAPSPPPAPTPPPPPSSSGCLHVVQSGETLSGLVGGRWPQVAAANGIRWPFWIFAGSTINLCAGGGGAAPARAGCVTVRSGDTLSGLFGARWPAVARAHRLRPPYRIFPGQRICG